MEGTFVGEDRLSYALFVLAGDVCLRINPCHVDVCRRLCVSEETAIPPNALCTWLCEDAHFFTLFRSGDATLVFCHTTEVLYYASMEAQIAPSCPPGLCFLCQFTIDVLPEGATARMLVFDVYQFGAPCQADPEARGELLRNCARHLPGPLCCVQWIGHRKYLTSEFIAGLPHGASGLMCLGGNPLVLDCFEPLDGPSDGGMVGGNEPERLMIRPLRLESAR